MNDVRFEFLAEYTLRTLKLKVRVIRSKKTVVLVPYLNKAGYTATPVACGWAGAVFEVTRSFRQEQ